MIDASPIAIASYCVEIVMSYITVIASCQISTGILPSFCSMSGNDLPTSVFQHCIPFTVCLLM